MAKSILDILIQIKKQGDADKDAVKGLVNIKKGIMDAAAVGGTFVAAGLAIKGVLDQSLGTFVAYADNVRRVQDGTGLTAEESSKLIQVLDDEKVAFEQLEKVIQKNGKTFDYSIRGIGEMSDQYLKLGTAREKAAFMEERFGKAWLSFVPVMEKGSDAIQDASDSMQANLVLTQEAVDNARNYEIAMDAVSDSIEGAKISLGAWIGALIAEDSRYKENIAALQELDALHGKTGVNYRYLSDQQVAYIAQIERGRAMTEFYSQAVQQNTESVQENAEAAEAQSKAHQSMLGLVGKIAGEFQSFEEKQASLTQRMAENRAEAELLYPWQAQQLEELNVAYADMAAEYDRNAEAHRAAMAKIQYDLFITKISVGGITDAEYEMAQQAGLTFGVFDQRSVDAAKNMDAVAQAVADGKIKIEDMGRALEMLPDMKSIDVVINALTNIGTTGHEQQYDSNGNPVGGGYAAGGIATGPESGHWELLHGTEAVIPLQNGSIPVQMMGGGSASVAGAGDTYYITLSIESAVSVVDRQSVQTVLQPFIIDGIRKARAQGAIR